MGSKINKKRGQPEQPAAWSSQLTGLLWIASGLILLLSQLSYSPSDLPEWGILEPFSSKGNTLGGNWLGAIGGCIAFVQILLFGAAGWLLALGLLWFGIVTLAAHSPIWPRIALGLIVILISGSVFLHSTHLFFVEWAARCRIPSPGGVLGNCIAGFLLIPFIGSAGTAAIAIIAYIIGLIWLTGQAPSQFFSRCYHIFQTQLDSWKMSRTEAGRAHSQERHLLLEREKQREQRRTDREVSKLKDATTTNNTPAQKELAIRETPLPQIIDASQRRSTSGIAIGEKPFERKKHTHQSLSITGFEDYELPGFDLLDEVEIEAEAADHAELIAIQSTIVSTLKAFGIDVTPGDITRGPTITRYEIYPSIGLRVSRISQLEADIARATCAERINILAPIPGKDTVGIEIANSSKVAVPLHELLHDPEFRSAKKKIPLALGKDVYGKTVIGDLAAMPHLLVAGATGSGKSVCINSIIASILFKFAPDELRFIMVDPKVVEMQMYNKLPHMVVPVVTDPKKTVAALKWVVNEMEKRYKIFAKMGVRNFDGFNNRPREEKEITPLPEPIESEIDLSEIEANALAHEEGDLGPEADQEELEIEDDEIPDRFPYIVVLIDELADLMQTAPADVEMCIARIAQKARAAGIHLIIATQTPRADVVTGIIKANIPSRIAFQVSSALDSRVILDTKGADKLVGKGDMLYLPPGSAKLERAQGAFVSDEEVERIVQHCANQAKPRYENNIRNTIDSANGDDEEEDISEADEELIIKCIEVVRQEQKASTSLLQRRLRLGYTRAARMVDILEQRGIVGPGEGAKAREVFLK